MKFLARMYNKTKTPEYKNSFDRDRIKKQTLAEIGYERRTGYNWCTDAPHEIFDLYPSWKAR
jgi:hypothetical protein